MIISVTERQLYKRCRRRWDLSSFNRQSLTPIINAPALEMGTLVHAVLAAWTDQPQEDPIQICSDMAAQALKRIIDSYEERVGCKPSKDELMPTFDSFALASAMIKNYKEHWKRPLPDGFTLVRNEQTVTNSIPSTDHCKYTNMPDQECDRCPCEGCWKDDFEDYEPRCTDIVDYSTYPPTVRCICCVEQHALESTFDGVMADVHGQLFIIERKTYSRRPSEDDLDENDQFLAYMWALKQTDIGIVRGLSYDGLWKRDKPPAGRTYSDLFLRKILTRNDQEIDEFQSMLAQEAMEMANNPPIYKTVPVLGGCWDCGYRALCKSMSRSPQHHTDMLLKMYTRSDHKRHLRQDEE